MQLTRLRLSHGFSLVEMAMVLFILGLLLITAMYTLQAQQEQRAREETQRRLEHAREAVLGYAVANGRLPCPANGATGVQSETTPGAGDCTAYVGYLPAVTIGLQPVDANGFAIDAWNNRIRYAVANSISDCTGSSTTPHFTSKTNLKANGMSCRPSDNQLLICKSTQSTPPPAVGDCGPSDGSNSVTNKGTVVVVIFSTGPNFATATGSRPDEDENTDGDTLFISHTPQAAGAPGGEFDDLMVWIPVGLLYGRLSAAGVLP